MCNMVLLIYTRTFVLAYIPVNFAVDIVIV
jgi:hypothetical protein